MSAHRSELKRRSVATIGGSFDDTGHNIIDNSVEIAKLNENANESQVFELLSPIIEWMERLLTWPKSSNKLSKRFNQKMLISLLLAHIYAVDIFLEYIFDPKPRTMFWRFLQLSACFRALVIISIIDLRFLRYQKVMLILKDLSRYPTFNFEFSLTALSPTVKNLKICYLAFIFIQTVVSIDVLFRESSESDPYLNLIFHTHFHNSKLLSMVTMFIKCFCYLYFIIFNECLYKIYFLCICLMLRNKIRDFNSHLRELERSDVILNTNQIQQIYRKHCILTTMVEGIEDNFSIQSFLWVFSLAINICVKIQVIVSGIKTLDFSLFPFFLTDLVYLGVILVSILLVSSEICEPNSGPILSMTKIGENADINDSNLQQMVQLVITKLNTPIMTLTGWNCFELNKSFLLTVMGALITFTIVVLQIS